MKTTDGARPGRARPLNRSDSSPISHRFQDWPIDVLRPTSSSPSPTSRPNGHDAAPTLQRLSLFCLPPPQFLRSRTHKNPTQPVGRPDPSPPNPAHTNSTGMAAPRLRVVLWDYNPPSAACQVQPAEPLPLADEGDGTAVVRAMQSCVCCGCLSAGPLTYIHPSCNTHLHTRPRPRTTRSCS